MRPVQVGPLDACHAAIPDAVGELPGEILRERMRRSGSPAADRFADEVVVVAEAFGEGDCDLVGRKEGVAEVMAGFAGRDVENAADARFDREIFPDGHVIGSRNPCLPRSGDGREQDGGGELRGLTIAGQGAGRKLSFDRRQHSIVR